MPAPRSADPFPSPPLLRLAGRQWKPSGCVHHLSPTLPTLRPPPARTAQYNLGAMYATGRGVERDYEKAVELYQQAAEQGLPQAQYSLGIMFENGKGVGKDLTRAEELFRKAAASGHERAVRHLEKLITSESV